MYFVTPTSHSRSSPWHYPRQQLSSWPFSQEFPFRERSLPRFPTYLGNNTPPRAKQGALTAASTDASILRPARPELPDFLTLRNS